jgi:hypothetical protein
MAQELVEQGRGRLGRGAYGRAETRLAMARVERMLGSCILLRLFCLLGRLVVLLRRCEAEAVKVSIE